jgi:O-antigen ligase
MPHVASPQLAQSAPGPVPPLESTSLLSHVFSFETAFAAFIYTMFWKRSTLTQGFPLDMTLIASVISGLAGVSLLVGRRVSLPRTAFRVPFYTVLLSVWAILSLFWTSSPRHGPYKAAYMLLLTLWSVIGGTIIGHERTRLARFTWVTLILAVAVALDCATTPGIRNWPPEPLRLFQCLPMGAAVISGIGSVLVWAILVHRAASIRGLQWLPVVALATTGYVLIDVGNQRGPLLFMAVLPVLTLIAGYRTRSTRLTGIAVFILASATALVILYLAGSAMLMDLSSMSRFRGLTAETGYGGRLQLFARALDMWMAKPFHGQGIAGFAGDAEQYTWAHNIVLETLAELGIVGAFLLLAVLGAAVRQLLQSDRRWADPEWMLVAGLLTYTFLLNLKSGDLVGAKWVWAALGMTSVGLRRPSSQPGSRSAPG